MTNPTLGVRLGGSGYSYGDYSLPSSKKPVLLDDEDVVKPQTYREKKKGFLDDKEIEIFLFTIKDPVKTVIARLMDLISEYGTDVIPEIDIPLAEMGPLGYTSLHAFKPTMYKKTDTIIKSVVR